MEKKFIDYVRRRMDEDAMAPVTPTPDTTMQKATATATAQALRQSPVDIAKAKTNPHALNKLRASALFKAAKNPSLTAIPNITDIDGAIGVQDQPNMMRKKMRR